jgi:hypothetical protein
MNISTQADSKQQALQWLEFPKSTQANFQPWKFMVQTKSF